MDDSDAEQGGDQQQQKQQNSATKWRGYQRTKFFVNQWREDGRNGDEQECAQRLVDEFCDYLLLAAKESEKLMRARFHSYLEQFREKKEFFYELSLPYKAALGEAKRRLKKKPPPKPAGVAAADGIHKQQQQQNKDNGLAREALRILMEEENRSEEEIQELKDNFNAVRRMDALYHRLISWLMQVPILGFNSVSNILRYFD